jgi:AAA+ ATPase superfamily predicted ATPase
MIGREYEIGRLQESFRSNSSELIAVYGRRRVGKTYLIRNACKAHLKFEVTGLYGGNREQQLAVFYKQLQAVSSIFKKQKMPQNWEEAFELLKTYIKSLTGKKKKVIFIDEFPWFDTHKSDFLMYFGHFWNTFCEKRKDLVIIICGSAASYIVQNIVSNKGSLHARLTYKIQLQPFSLYETKQYLMNKGMRWSNYNILQIYIALGGIPHYLNKIKKGESAVQNIQRMCFDANGDLINEFKEVFESLFTQSNVHITIVKKLAGSKKGITRDELLRKTGFSGGGHFSKALEELSASGFVKEYPAIGKKKKMTLYRLVDEYSNFYLKYIEPNKNQGKNFWKTMAQQQSYISWAGFNFETICLQHIEQIKKALGIEGVHSTNSSWSTKGAQVDLVIARKDHWINLCEIKFYHSELVIGATLLNNLKNKINLFKKDTKTKDTIALTMITTYGVVQNNHYHEIVENNLTMDVLFEKP